MSDETKWSPEPWHVVELGEEDETFHFIHDARDKSVADVIGNDGVEVDGANARRIVACVNACAGIPTEALEQAGVGGLRTAMEQMEEHVARAIQSLGKTP